MIGSILLHLIVLAALVAAVLGVLDVAMGAWERVTEVPELAGLAAERSGQRLLATGGGLSALTLAYLVHQRGAAALVLVAVGVMAVLGLMAWTGRPPHGLPRRVPWRLGCFPWLGWHERLYLGWSRGLVHRWRLAMTTPEDTFGALGPPGSRKTLGVIVPQLLLWAGPAISTSTKPDVLRATAARRAELGRRYGGEVHVYAPAAQGPVEELNPVHWSPLAGCQDQTIAKLRVDALVEAADTAKGMENADHWRAGAARLLRPYFLAAAWHPHAPGDVRWVRRWLSGQHYDEPLAILRALDSKGAAQWAADLEGVHHTPEKERGSFFSAAENTLAMTSAPAVMASCSRTDLDVERFLKTRSTLYIVSPSEHQKAVAPLISALIESIITTAYDLHRRGELPARLLVSLDELANIAALPNLSTHVSQGRGQGVIVGWAAQSHAQLRDRYGEDTAEAIWSATTARLVFGGLADQPHLVRMVDLIGERRIKTKHKTRTRRGGGGRHDREVSTQTQWIWRPRLTTEQLRTIRQGWALLLYRDRKPYCLRVPIAWHCWLFRRGLLPWRAPAPESPPPLLEVVPGGLDEPAEEGPDEAPGAEEREAEG